MDAIREVLRAEQVRVGYGETWVLPQLTLSVAQGTLAVIVGPNGSGKSTLLRALARLLRTHGGAIYLDGQALHTLPTVEIARRLAILPQGPSTPATLTVRELVEQGRYPHVGAWGMLRRQDHAAVTEALALTGMEPFAERPLDALSGGERQRAWIALALAQVTPVLLLDEPTTFLDVGHQLEVLELVQRLHAERKLTLVMVLHDLNQAARYAERLIVMQAGRIVADGEPHEVMTPALLAEVFRIQATVIPDPVLGTPLCLPYATIR